MKNVRETELKLFCSRIEYCQQSLSKAEFTTYLSLGMPRSVFDRLESNNYAAGNVFNERATLFLDGNEIADSHRLLEALVSSARKKQRPNKLKRPREGSFSAVSERFMKRAWWGLTIYEPFDEKKLTAEISYDFIDGSPQVVETFSILYDGRDLDFLEDSGTDYGDMYLVDKKGTRHRFGITEDEVDEY